MLERRLGRLPLERQLRQPQQRFLEPGVQPQRLPVLALGLLQGSSKTQDLAQVVAICRVFGLDPHRLPELLQGRLHVTASEEGRSQALASDIVPGVRLDRPAVLGDLPLDVTLEVGDGTAHHVGRGAGGEAADLRQQRVGAPLPGVTAETDPFQIHLLHLGGGLLHQALPTQRQGQCVARLGELRPPHQGGPEMADGGSMVAGDARRLSQPVAGGGAVRVGSERPLEQRRRRLGIDSGQQHLAQPHQGRRVPRPLIERPAQGGGGFRELTAALVDVTQQVGGAKRAQAAFEGHPQAGLGGLEEVVGDVGLGQQSNRRCRLGALRVGGENRVHLLAQRAQLLAHRGVERPQFGVRDGRRAGSRHDPVRTRAGAERQDEEQQIRPAPTHGSVLPDRRCSRCRRSTVKGNDDRLPSGQRTCAASGPAAPPSPTRNRGSLAEA